MTLITRNKYAQHRRARGLPGGTAEAVRKAVESGRITLQDGKVDPDVADLQWARHTRAKAGDVGSDHTATDDGGSLTDARMAESKARTQLLEIEIAEKRGTLVNAKAARDVFFQCARKARDTLTTIPARLSAMLSDEARIALTLEIKRVCEELAKPPLPRKPQ